MPYHVGVSRRHVAEARASGRENVFVKNDENAPRDKRAMFRANANKRGALEREKSQPGKVARRTMASVY